MIYKLRLISNSAFDYPMDGQCLAALDGKIEAYMGWNSEQSPITNSFHYSYDPNTGIITKRSDALPRRRHDCGYGTALNKIWLWGDDSSFPSDYDRGVYSYDNTNGWQLFLADFGTDIGNRQLSIRGIHNDHAYIGGGTGVTNVDSMYKISLSTGIVSYVGELPMANLESGFFISFGGAIYIGGGGTLVGGSAVLNNKVWKSTNDGASWIEIGTGDFGYWCNGAATNDAMFVVKGSNENATQHKKGILWSTDGITWNELVYTIPIRHATGVCGLGSDLYIATGNLHNDFWLLKRIDD